MAPAAVSVFPSQDMVSSSARRPLAGDAELRRDLRRGARGISRRETRRRHGDLLHRAEPQAPARRPCSTTSRTPPARPCTRPTTARSWRRSRRCRTRSLDPRASWATLPYRIGPSQIGCRENPYGKLHRAEPGQCPRLPQPYRPAPARPLQRRLDARLYRRLRPRRHRGDGARGAHRFLRPHLPPQPTSRSPTSTRCDRPAVYPVLPRDRRPRAACRRAPARDRGLARRSGRGARAARRRAHRALARQPGRRARHRRPSRRTSCGAARIVTLDAEAFEALTTQPDYLNTAAHALPGGPIRLDPCSVARLQA